MMNLSDTELVKAWKDAYAIAGNAWLEIHRRRLQRLALGQDYDRLYPSDKDFYHVSPDGGTYQLADTGVVNTVNSRKSGTVVQIDDDEFE